MSLFELGTLRLELERYPQQEEITTLQAWDAADEYLLETLDITAADGKPLLIFNDTFGALGCALSAHQPYSISDSYMAQLAVRHNLALNGWDPESVHVQDSLAPLPAAPGLVVMRVPKTLALLEQQLKALRRVVTPETVIIAGAKARDIHTSTLQLFEKILGPTKTSLAKKKARLIFGTVADLPVDEKPVISEWALDGTDYRIANHANVFSRGGLDIGARLFMQHLPENLEGRIADLGCGNGIIGLIALGQNPDAELLFIDESYMAVASSEMNVVRNRPQDQARCAFQVDNLLAHVERDSLQAVLCNPPFHQQSTVTDVTAWQMFCDAKRCLQDGGELRIVGNRHLDYYHKLKRLFGNCETLASSQKFVVLRAVKTRAYR
ncbi:23S rRNA (guanine(1835)-N(2))-methyltransferase RlmG [Chimaeribacter californicus]|uniref:Ribosomal RNA large subunit methyltransferase G n=1 Tax=Chimaeribacter californicus TaxID=2060067 RepID=A0A2N5E530_9GAMM|nr:23S rRNA (guanine(1835)-N(2))-methyltransferase RlmG [Chimaeribacter californicus]PLR36265.1 23S rRNA (guanine(1835)-N(2))-methyltransferase RlmG [Chimaeribacter californicus]